jgi:hypothetical protein
VNASIDGAGDAACLYLSLSLPMYCANSPLSWRWSHCCWNMTPYAPRILLFLIIDLSSAPRTTAVHLLRSDWHLSRAGTKNVRIRRLDDTAIVKRLFNACLQILAASKPTSKQDRYPPTVLAVSNGLYLLGEEKIDLVNNRVEYFLEIFPSHNKAAILQAFGGVVRHIGVHCGYFSVTLPAP